MSSNSNVTLSWSATISLLWHPSTRSLILIGMVDEALNSQHSIKFFKNIICIRIPIKQINYCHMLWILVANFNCHFLLSTKYTLSCITRRYSQKRLYDFAEGFKITQSMGSQKYSFYYQFYSTKVQCPWERERQLYFFVTKSVSVLFFPGLAQQKVHKGLC